MDNTLLYPRINKSSKYKQVNVLNIFPHTFVTSLKLIAILPKLNSKVKTTPSQNYNFLNFISTEMTTLIST
jgi:hypothetical protein